ncbi:hypothetical protein [Actinotalea sp. Marseille-Q4924]|uniref:hypothetical protein n=1 Tax=Actinotalea sp. Marseille-Q4924 TaxID=2866571 RepID=UPI001CE48387|nr:hypothetical protein [Actinotalea sp. Marseille-Q4924]
MNASTLPDRRVLAAEHAYRREVLRDAARPLVLPDVAGSLGRLADAVRRTRAATRPSGAGRARTRRTVADVAAAAALPPRDLPLGHSVVCR